MSGSDFDSKEILRLNMQVSRAETPQLYDELKKFSKGVPRTNRFKMLAYERLLVGDRPAASPPAETPSMVRPILATSEVDEKISAANELFTRRDE